MTHEPERVDRVLQDVFPSISGALYSRLLAALSHERESKRLAVMKVAHQMERIPGDGFTEPATAAWAAALRKAVE